MKFKQSPNQRQRFVLSPEIFKAISSEEIDKTWEAFKKMDLNKPPYQFFEIEVSSINVFSGGITIPRGTQYEDFDRLLTEAARRVENVQKNNFNILVKYDFSEDLGPEPALISMWADSNDGKFARFERPKAGVDVAEVRNKFGLHEIKASSINGFTFAIYKLLVVMLATKNIEKRIEINKLAKLGIGKNKHKPYQITYLKIGKITQTVTKSGKAPATGDVLIPHYRSGHWRHHQHYGLGNKFEKSVYIHAVFVNADKDWVGDRTEYRVL